MIATSHYRHAPARRSLGAASRARRRFTGRRGCGDREWRRPDDGQRTRLQVMDIAHVGDRGWLEVAGEAEIEPQRLRGSEPPWDLRDWRPKVNCDTYNPRCGYHERKGTQAPTIPLPLLTTRRWGSQPGEVILGISAPAARLTHNILNDSGVAIVSAASGRAREQLRCAAAAVGHGQSLLHKLF